MLCDPQLILRIIFDSIKLSCCPSRLWYFWYVQPHMFYLDFFSIILLPKNILYSFSAYFTLISCSSSFVQTKVLKYVCNT